MAFLFALFSALALAAAPTGAWPTPVVLTTDDGVALQATVGAPPKADKGVVFVHMAGREQTDWQGVVEPFYRQGLLVLTLDLRGHGANVTGAPPTLTGADWSAMTKDVRAGVAELRRRGAKKVAIVGAEVGANLALNVAADDSGIASVVLLSPGLDYKGILTGEAAKRYDRSVLFVASSEDTYAVRCANALDSVVKGPHKVQVLENAGKGTRMFNHEPTLTSVLVGFVNTSWTAPAASQAKGTVDITVETKEMETNGPRIGDAVPPPPK